jgi:hypothetical protein
VLLKAACCGDGRLRVAQFLANLWQGVLVVVYGTNTGAVVPAALDHKRLAPLVQCCPRRNWVEGAAQGNETKTGQAVLSQSSEMTADVACGAAWLLQAEVEGVVL